MSEFLRLKCYECASIMRTVARQAGKRSRCPACGSPLRIPSRKVFEEFSGKKVRALREPEWDLNRVRAKRELERRQLYRSNQIESNRYEEETDESSELRASPPGLAQDANEVPAELGESLIDLGGLDEGLLAPHDSGVLQGPLPRRGEADPRKRKHSDELPSHKAKSTSGDSFEFDEYALEEFFDEFGAPPEGASMHRNDVEEFPELPLEEESSGQNDFTPSDLELEPVDGDPGGSADFHELLDELATDEDLDL